MKSTIFSGEVKSGQGKGVHFTQLDWVRNQCQEKLGIAPYPGTFNLVLKNSEEIVRWKTLRKKTDIVVNPPDSQYCAAHSYPVRINSFLPGAIIYPNVSDYPENQLEIISPLHLRQTFGLTDGDIVQIEIDRPLEIQAVIFDIDGTLIDTLEAYRVCTEKAFAPLQIPITTNIIRHYFATHQPFWKSLLPTDTSKHKLTVDDLETKALQYFPDALRKYGKIIPSLSQTIDQLCSKGLKLGIFTGSTSEVLEPLKKQNLLSCFHAITTAEDIKHHKPHPEGLQHCLRQLKVKPTEAVYVGDTTMDIQACRATGTKSVAVLSGAGDCSKLAAEGPDRIIHSHQNLPAIVNRKSEK